GPPADHAAGGTGPWNGRSRAASPPDARSPGACAAPTLRAAAGREASGLFCDELLQDVAVEAQVRHQPLQLAVLLAELPELAELQAGVLLLPEVECLLTDPVL